MAAIVEDDCIENKDGVAEILKRQLSEAEGAFLQGGSESLLRARSIYSCILTVLHENLIVHKDEKLWQEWYFQCKLGISKVYEGLGEFSAAETCLRYAIKDVEKSRHCWVSLDEARIMVHGWKEQASRIQPQPVQSKESQSNKTKGLAKSWYVTLFAILVSVGLFYMGRSFCPVAPVQPVVCPAAAETFCPAPEECVCSVETTTCPAPPEPIVCPPIPEPIKCPPTPEPTKCPEPAPAPEVDDAAAVALLLQSVDFVYLTMQRAMLGDKSALNWLIEVSGIEHDDNFIIDTSQGIPMAVTEELQMMATAALAYASLDPSYDSYKSLLALPTNRQLREEVISFLQHTMKQLKAPTKQRHIVLWLLGNWYSFGNQSAKALDVFQEAAKGDLAVAHGSLADLYLNGVGVSRNVTKAVELYEKAAGQGDVFAQWRLGSNYYGNGTTDFPTDFPRAVRWLTLAAEQGHAKAQVLLGECYQHGYGVTVNHVRSFELYSAAAIQGLASAQLRLGICYYDGSGVMQNYATAFEWFNRAAGQRDAEANRLVGVCFSLGHGVPQNYAKAFEFFTHAANYGSTLAPYHLGLAYLHGQGVVKSESQALEWLSKAAEHSTAAKYELGRLHEVKTNLNHDFAKAKDWFQQAAQEGHRDAQAALGRMYHYGLGVAVSNATAVDWYRKAADQGDAVAQIEVGVAYYFGHGVTKDYKEALMWCTKAAGQNNARAQRILGIVYESGVGLPKKDFAAATRWYSLAAQQSDPVAQKWCVVRGWLWGSTNRCT